MATMVPSLWSVWLSGTHIAPLLPGEGRYGGHDQSPEGHPIDPSAIFDSGVRQNGVRFPVDTAPRWRAT